MLRQIFSRYKIIFAISALLFVSGCSLWQNFTTYFNLYYNTRTLFREAEEEIFSQKRDLFSTEQLVVPGTANNKLTKVIEKSSKILQFHATTAYVDDALMMLGKSFYYQLNFQKSKRKFEELLATNPDDDIQLEAELWIAKCNLKLRDVISGLTLLADVRSRAIESDYDDIVQAAFIEEIIYRISTENYADAIVLSEQLIPYVNSNIKSSIYFELGKLYTKLDDLNNAIIAYENVFEYSPDFDLEINSTINYAIALRSAGKNEEALNVFRDMRRKDKFNEKFNEIDLETAITLDKLGDYEQALDQFNIIDTTYRNTPIAAAASYYKGRIYEYALFDYDSAAFYYQKAASGNQLPQYVDSAKSKNQLFAKYFNLRNQINDFNRQLFYTENPEVFVQDSIDYVQDSLNLLAEYLEQQELQNIWSNVLQQNQIALDDSLMMLDSLRIQDSLAIRDSLMNLMYLGNFTDTNEVNLALEEYFRTKDSLHVRDSLMALIETGAFLDTNDVNRALEEYFKNKENLQQVTPDGTGQALQQSLTGVNLDSVEFKKNPPRKPTIPIDSVKYIIAKTQLELGNLFLTEINVSDSAYHLYINNVERFSDSEFYPSTLFALGSYYETVDNQTKADSLFQYIYDNYKTESIVNAAAFKLNLPLIDLEYDPAKSLYTSAESAMIAGDYDLALKEFLSIYRLYPESDYSPKGLYAAGWVLEKDLQMFDSAAVVYDTLNIKYSATIYARNVAKKLSGYKQELYRIQQEQEEKLLALETESTDSSLNGVTELKNDEESIGEVIDQIPETEIEELAQKDVENLSEIIAGPDTIIPLDKERTVKLEALWNPRKPR